jgi:hypothetical protein
MRAGLALIAVLALCATPAVAQGKTKGAPASLAVLDICEQFATGELKAAADYATVLGWMVNEEPGESPYSITYAGFKGFAEVGDGNLWVQVESYPGAFTVVCRVDMDMAGPDADAQVEALDQLDWLDGGLTRDDTGIYGSWSTNGSNPGLVLGLQGPDGFTLQFTSIIHSDTGPMH